MPKVSFAKKDAIEVSLGIQEGFIEVIGAITKMHQYPPNKKSGEQSGPFCCVQLEVARLDDKGVRLDDTSIFQEFTVGGNDRNNPGQFKFHPGKAESGADEDPEDMGTEVDVEGNCLFAEEGSKLNKQSKWIRFTDSLEEKGFKSDVLANGYMPDLIGLKCHVHTITLPKMPNSTSEKENTAIVADKVLQFPYDVKKGKAAAGKAATAAAASKPGPKIVPAAAPVAAPAGVSDDPEVIALEKLTALVNDAEYSGKDGVERKKIQTVVQTKLMRERVNTKLHKPVMDLIKNDEWLTNKTMEDEDSPIYGRIVVDFEAGTASIVAA